MSTKRTFITGVNTGLGNALAKAFLSKGYSVSAISRNCPDDLKANSQFRFQSVDLSRLEEIRDSLKTLLGDIEDLDLVILNAGILGDIKDLRETSLREIETVMNINVWANKLLYDALLDSKIKIRQVVAISSGAAFNGSGGWGAYSISKAALNLLFRVYAHEQPETHFTCLAPGLVSTQMLDYVCSLNTDERYPAVGRIRGAFGTDRMQTTEQAAERVCSAIPQLLAHDSGSFIDIRNL